MKAQTEEFKRVLQMIEKGEISPQEGYRLITARNTREDERTAFQTLELRSPSLIHHLTLQPQNPAEPSAGEVQILVHAFSLNFGDLLCVKGMYPTMPEYPFTPGLEISGIVMKTGTAVTSFEPGDEVIGLMGERMGGQSSVVNLPERLVVKKPRTISFEEACAFPVVFTTVHHIFETAKINKGEKMLIQTAAGGVGLIAVQMAKLRGVECFVTAGSQEKADYLRSLDVEHVIHYREEDFEERVRKLSGGYGVDVVINTLSGDAIQKGINLLAPGGRYMEIAQTGLNQAAKLDLSKLIHNQTFHSIDLRRLVLQKPELIQGYLDIMRRMLAAGEVRPTVGHVFKMSDIQKAYQCLENRENIGKVVVVPDSVALTERLIPAYASKREGADSEREAEPVGKPEAESGAAAIPPRQEIAIIGLSCRFPGAANAGQFWDNLSRGISSISEVPGERWSAKEFYDPDPQKLNKTYSKWGGFLNDIDKFDASFFNMSGKEAELTDPQQRLFLEEGWSALEDAGYANDVLSNRKCAVFAGVGSSDYRMNLTTHEVEPQSMWGNESSILPARISYFLNLKGPSITVNTACSSSLVAIHLACQTIASGESEMAVAGGAFISTTPYFHIASSSAGMLSPTGQCRAFDQEADGFVPGEGVAAIVLKDLESALRDGDHIYGVIKGSGVNQDGKTNGITAPSTLSQTELELEVHRKAGIHPEDIQYIEAHGTGTKLGDPIEIEALTNAFRPYTSKKQFCPIGSVKTNIGHASAAAGIAGVIKVLLAMKHRQLPPSLNYESCNQHIDMEDSPFYVNTGLRNWPKKGGVPRIATVSSFGFSGTNAHVVLAESPFNERRVSKDTDHEQAFIPLSAKTEAALRRKAADLLLWLQGEGEKEALASISYTLCKGRKHFPVRSVFVVRSKQELERSLAELMPEAINTSSLKQKAGDRRKMKQLAEEIANARANRSEELVVKLSELAEGYLQGYEPIWEALFTSMQPQLLSMPTYPFQREHYWFEVSGQASSAEGLRLLHPLVHRNTSSMKEVQFTTTLAAEDWQIGEHLIEGEPMLPAAAYVEMALAAARLLRKEVFRRLAGLVWQTPFRLNGGRSKEICISLYLQDDRLEFEIWSPDKSEQRVVHATGCLLHHNQRDEYKPDAIPVAEISFRCANQRSGETLYTWFTQSGFAYGKSYHTIQQLCGDGDELLAKLKLPQSLVSGDQPYLLHPSLLDGAFQAVLGSAFEAAADASAESIYLPFSLDELRLYRPMALPAYAYVRRAEDSRLAMPRYDIDLADEAGERIARLQGFAIREWGNKDLAQRSEESAYHRPQWTAQAVMTFEDQEPPESLLLLDDEDDLYTSLQQYVNKNLIWVSPGETFEEIGFLKYRLDPAEPTHYRQLMECLNNKGIQPSMIVKRWSPGNERGEEKVADIEAMLERGMFSLFHLTQSMIQHQWKHPVYLQYLYPVNGTDPADSAVAGWMHSAALEHPNYQFACIETDSSIDLGKMCMQEWAARTIGSEKIIRYRNGERFVTRIKPVALEQLPSTELLLHEEGVYLITGGMGSIGFAVAQWFASQGGVKLALVGRTPQNPDMESRLIELRELGAEALYCQCDIADKSAVQTLIDRLRKQFGSIRGIVHSAGMVRDGLIRNKKLEDIKGVLAPKVQGTLWLDRYTRGEPLDFFVLFSSLASVVGNAGQSDYAYANAYMDAFARLRLKWQKKGKRQGATVSINWPLWLDGGMNVSPELMELMKDRGFMPIRTEEGLQILSSLLRVESGQWIVLGEPGLPWKESDQSMKKQESIPKGQTEHLTPHLMQFLVHILSRETRTPASRIKTDEPLETYGIDSAMIVNMTRVLERDFGMLSKTLFFEYQTLDELAAYFLEKHRDRAQMLFGCLAENETRTSAQTSGTGNAAHQSQLLRSDRAVHPAGGKKPSNQRALNQSPSSQELPKGEPIAIIGLSGKYPMADSLDEFWDNLRAGKDCITEIPSDRWDVSRTSSYSKWGGFISDVDKFDALFFQISPREAVLMDPQERLFMQVVWHALEDAGYTRSRLKRSRTGVYVGMMYGQYQLLGASNAEQGEGFVPSSSYASVANRISYMLDLHGPSMAVDTMCSASLTALHLACQSLRSGECDTAIVGGVNVSIHPYKYHLLSQGKFASTDGRCRSFGEGGDGYVPGEGIGAMLLKPLRKAVEDGDTIHGLIRGSALNHGGKTNGYSVPNPIAQSECITAALKEAGVSSEEISYMEAHGTGTALGDPIEITGLSQAYIKHTTAEQYCSIGSVKSNIGHLESAAGIAGITKILLQMKHKQLVPSLHSQSLNPNIHFQSSPFYVQQELEEWQPISGKRIAAISSFGAGGSNAHVILEEWPRQQERLVKHGSPGPYLFLLSARNESRLSDAARQLMNYVRKHHELEPSAVAWTLQHGREAMDARLAIVAADLTELAERLDDYAQGSVGHGSFAGRVIEEGSMLGEGKAAQHFVASLALERNLEQLARLWISGAAVDWSLLYGAGAPNMISLPGYPFAKERHWLDREVSGFGPEVIKRDIKESAFERASAGGEFNAFEPISAKRESEASIASADSDIESSKAVAVDSAQLLSGVSQDIQRLAAAIVQLEIEHLDVNESLSNFGFDSVMLKELSDALTSLYSIPITPTIFFEQGDIANLSKALLRDFNDELVRHYSEYGVGNKNTRPETAMAAAVCSQRKNEFDQTERNKSDQVQWNEPIAIIGMSGQFPQSEDLEQFWSNLELERDLITEIPEERWDWRLFESEGGYARWGGFVRHADTFDPRFFQITPLEAEMMDPQQRVALQAVWHAFEDAGYRPSHFSGRRVGLFIGAQFQDYLQLLHDDGEMNALVGTGNELSILVNRISYQLNFKGPSEPYNTACSSSAVAIHRAIQSIRSGESEIAVAGGISLFLAPYGMISAGRMGILSSDGRCKTLDKSANGYVKGEGVGMLMLKPLSKALADRDNIHAVIRGSAVNHGGKAQSLTAPNSSAQSELLVSAYDDAGIGPETVGYLELHGTGTELGDPTEIEGIKKAFQLLKDKQAAVDKLGEAYCGIGSVKTNIGHLEPASGIAGILKVILSMKHKKLPGLLHLNEVNPYVQLERSPFYIVRSTREWKRLKNERGEEIPLRAGVSSFGFGGVNAHVVLEEAPEQDKEQKATRNVPSKPRLFILSARNEQRLHEYVRRILPFIKNRTAAAGITSGQWGQAAAATIADMIGVRVEELDWSEPFEEYGIRGEEWSTLLKRITGRDDLPVTVNMQRDYSSIARLAEYLSHLGGASVGSSESAASSVLLADMIYTLQTGREEMNERLACIVESFEELYDILEKYVQGDHGETRLHLGSIKRTRTADRHAETFHVEDIHAGDLDKLARHWVSGGVVDWLKLNQREDVRKMSLPLYPFAKERYWAPKSNPGLIAARDPLTDSSAAIAATAESLETASPAASAQEQSTEQLLARELRYVLADRLKMQPEEIEDEVELSEYGVDSMLSSIIVGVIQDRYGEVIDAGVVFQYPTIRALSVFLATEVKPTASIGHPERPVSQNCKPKLPPELIPINTKGTRQTSFWIHGATGYATVFRQLSQALGPDYKIYGFQARGTDGKTMPMMFEEMVEHYYQCIRTLQPQGPYFLGGYSFGALVAMEIARRLHREGEVILHLVMFDTYPPSDAVNDQFYDTYDFDFLKLFLANAFLKSDENPHLLISIDDIRDVPKRLQVGYLARLAKERSGTMIETDEIYNFIQGGLMVSDYAEEIYVTYRPTAYDISDVTFFKTTKGFVSDDNPFGLKGVNILQDYDYSEYWKGMVTQNIDVHTVECDHNSILEEPNLSFVADQVRRLLDSSPKEGHNINPITEYTRQGSRMLLELLEQSGLLSGAEKVLTKQELLERLNLPSIYHDLLPTWLEVLESDGLFYIKGE